MARNASVAQVRAWAKNNGFEIGDRGRLPAEVWDAWTAATKATGRRTNRAAPAPSTARPPAVDPAGLTDARDRISQLEQQLAQVITRLAALEAQPQPQPPTRRRFARTR